jgi:hypothetical protein
VESAELLVAADFFDAKVEWIGLMRIDQDRRATPASEHGGRGEPESPPPMIAMSVYFMGNPGRISLVLRPEKRIKAWPGKAGTEA